MGLTANQTLVKKKIREHDHIAIETVQNEANGGKKSEQSTSNLWNKIILLKIEVPEEDDNVVDGKILEEIMTKNIQFDENYKHKDPKSERTPSRKQLLKCQRQL